MLEAALALNEHVENARHELGRNPNSRVTDPHDDEGDFVMIVVRWIVVAPGLALTPYLSIQPDAAAWLCELRRVVEHVDEDLAKPHRIGIEHDFLGRQGDLQMK